ncbi:3-phytase [Elizabethkingia meningoseptica]|uniref:3-phytase n=1 Tax=Elizabethkingia meningoseptica TaxID=238 RepID=A0A1T3H9X1_ELIME|nr:MULTISPECIES: phytase [Elizabethkingia]AQX13767.1 3-phytase [Elizabethkingia meningoseptica]MBG0515565.1 phytase [Elizabethkingia meningoseptica]MDE5434068.1 phytase [Elizabethkingia meningoseptica]MDE5448887.1 phytase [Elizabethkingia meningoseptica]MDE5470345.1 phytase [Elizabethkingia meningoseptica]
MKYYFYSLLCCSVLSCSGQKQVIASPEIIRPVIVTEPVNFDSDDPAIWVNPQDPAKSLVIGTDKDINGGLFVFDLNGKIQKDLTVTGLKRPNNVDIAYGIMLNGKKTDIAVTTERFTHKLRIFSLPDMKPVDNGGIPVFEGQTGEGERDLMGISLYTDSKGKIYAIAGRKTGPQDGSYLWQYLLSDSGKGYVEGKLVRKFGHYSGKKEIESIAVDNENGYVYYSDEQYGVRKYYADPSKGNQELDVFAKTGFTEDHEGISIYKTGSKKGYILVSDQGANKFHIFRREGKNTLLKIVKVLANKSDGSDMVSIPLNNTFKHGLFVVMSDDKTFHYYRWEDIAGEELDIK